MAACFRVSEPSGPFARIVGGRLRRGGAGWPRSSSRGWGTGALVKVIRNRTVLHPDCNRTQKGHKSPQLGSAATTARLLWLARKDLLALAAAPNAWRATHRPMGLGHTRCHRGGLDRSSQIWNEILLTSAQLTISDNLGDGLTQCRDLPRCSTRIRPCIASDEREPKLRRSWWYSSVVHQDRRCWVEVCETVRERGDQDVFGASSGDTPSAIDAAKCVVQPAGAEHS